MTRLFISCIFN